MKKLRVTVENKVYEVLVEILDEGAPASLAPASPAAPASVAAPRPAQAAPVAAAQTNSSEAPPAKPPSSAGNPANSVPSPLAGKVVSVDVKVGQSITRDTQVLTIEAMKMNTYVYSSQPGVVQAILVSPGDSVDQGQPLVQLE